VVEDVHPFDGVVRMTQPSITCPKCHRTSYNPNDIREEYCGNCTEWHRHMRKPRNVIRTPVAESVARHDKMVSMLRTLTPTMSQALGTVYIEFGDAARANDFFDLLMSLVDE
jgi:hypothetical protein